MARTTARTLLRRTVVLAFTAVVLIGAVAVASISSSRHQSTGPAIPAPPRDPAPITVRANQTTMLALGDGADLIIPPGAMTSGARVRATYSGRPQGNWNQIRPSAAPVELVSEPRDAIHGLLRLEFPVPAPARGVEPTGLYGISTYDPGTGDWTPYASTFDAARNMVVAEIPHFSWWNPFSWDWASIAARVNQDVGQAVGRRAVAPSCHSQPPAWVAMLPGVSADAAVAVRACAQAQGDVLDVELVNNRPYGMVLQYGSSVKWGWHQEGDSAKARALNKLADALTAPGQLYLPPLGRASVGIFPTSPTTVPQFRIESTLATRYVDFVDHAADYLLEAVPAVGSCASLLAGLVTDGSAGAARDNIVSAGSCLLDGYKQEVASGALDEARVNQLAATVSGLKKASVAGKWWQVYGAEWQLADLLTDHYIVGDADGLGAGFSVLAHTAGSPSVPPLAAPPVAPPRAPQPTTPPPSTPLPPPVTYSETTGGQAHTWTNYTNAGGTEGPTIPAYTSVQIACKVQGFQVQDGNRWWYRIASGPWNDIYYVSADAFYNNGQTSGSLHGTPWVDNNVRDC